MNRTQSSSGWTSLAWWRRRKPHVFVGSRFCRIHEDNTVETAQVISLTEDLYGIPHVKYDLTFRRPQRAAPYREGPRCLSLETFARTYDEPALG